MRPAGRTRMMPSFLHAAALAGLAGVVLPILIHLLARPRPRTVVFSHLRFLRNVAERRARAFKLRRLLLLLLRVLAAVFLVLAFSRPVLMSGRAGSRTGVSAWIVDRSLSLQAGDAWTGLRSRAGTLAALSSPGERVALEWTAPVPAGGARRADTLTTASAAASAVERLEPLWSFGDVAAALDRAAIRLGRVPDAEPEMFLLTDGQASGFSPARPSAERDRWKGTLFVLPFGKPPDNVAVTDVRLEPPSLRRDDPPRIRAEIRNFGTSEVRGRTVRFFTGDEAAAETTVDLKPGATRIESVPIMEETGGWIRGKVQCGPDAFPQDDERTFAGFGRSSFRLLLAGGSVSDVVPFRYALESRPDAESRFEIRIFSGEGSWTSMLPSADAVFLVNRPLRSAAEASALRKFIESGGGALFVPGPDADVRRWNELLFAPAWGDTLVRDAAPDPGAGALAIGAPDPDEPLLRGVFEPGWKPRRSPRFYTAVRPSSPGRRAPLRFTNGDPFLSEWPLGRGMLHVLSGGVDARWSDFAVNPLFPALAGRCGQVLASLRDGRTIRAACGDSLVFFFEGNDGEARFQVELPSGERASVLPEPASGGFRAVLANAETPGLYRFFRNDSLEGIAAVNTDPRESDFRTVDESALKKLLPSARVVMLNGRDPIDGQIRDRRRGRELWREMLLLAVLCLIAETFITAVWK
jgi:hypothetical protein